MEVYVDRFKKWWVAAAAVGLLVVGIGMVRRAPALRPKVPQAPPAAPAAPAPAPRTNDFTPVSVQAPDDGVVVEGQVLDAAGKPVGKAQVSLASTQQVTLANAECTEDGRPLLSCDSPQTVQAVSGYLREGKGVVVAAVSTVADAQGRFRFEKLGGPSFSVWATAEGHGAAVRERVLPGAAVQVVLPPPRTVRGSVEGEDGKPVGGARVTVFSRRLPIPAAATTAADGMFSVAGLGEGPFYVFAEAEGRLSAAAPSVEAGEAARLRLPSPRTLEITTRADGQPLAATVRVQADHLSREVSADGSGVARLPGLPPGEVTVVAYAGERAAPPQRVLLGAGATPLKLDLVPAGSLKLTVTGDFGQALLDVHATLARPFGAPLLEKHSRMGEPLALGPVARGDYVLRLSARDFKTAELPVSLTALDLPVAVALTRASVIRGVVQDEYEQPVPGVEVRLEALGRSTRSDAAGHFVLPVPSAGQYVLSARHAEWGSGTVRVEAPAEQVRVMLEPRGTVDVLVEHNGRRVEGASAALRQGDRELLASEDPSGADGVVRLRGIPPGSYQVWAFHPELQAGEPLRVDLREGDSVRVRAVLGDGARVAGQVVDEKGDPVVGAELRAPGARRPALTDGQGRFELRALKPRATVALRFAHPGHDAPEQLSAVVGGGPVKLTVRARQLFSGRVVTPEGAPVGQFELNGREVRDADGRFAVPLPVVDGKVALSLRARGLLPKDVELPAARELGSVTLALAPRAVGTVKDESGKPVPQAVVTCKDCDEAGAAGPDGRFTLALPAGGGKVELAGRRWNMEGSATAEAGQGEVTLTLRAPTRLSGVVYDEQGKPAEGKEVAVLDAQRGTALMFVSGVKGTYRMEVAAGVYRFFVGGFVPGGPLSMSGREMLIHEVKGREATLDLGNAGGGTPLVVKVDPRPGHALWVVRGDVEKVGNPPEELNRAAYARLVYEPSTERLEFRGLAPGRYTVVWGGYHVDSRGGPKVVKVDVPTRDEVVLDSVPAP